MPKPAPRERKEPDHEGLQTILKEALGDALKNMPAAKPVAAPQTLPEEKKTLSLSALKKPEPVAGAPKLAIKTATDGHLSALQEAIARAGSPHAKQPAVAQPISTPTPVPAPVTPEPPVQDASLSEAVPAAKVPVQEPSVPSDIPKPAEIPETQRQAPIEEPTAKKMDPMPESQNSSTAPKRVREIPEDVLRKVLSE